jgi:hypothetical protein
MGMFDRLFRTETPDNRLEGMLKRIGDEFWFSLDKAADDFIPVVKRAAETRGVDPLYLYYVLFDERRRWTKLVGDNFLALELVLKVALKWSNKIPDWRSYQIPPEDKQRDVDEAIKAVARWANTEWADTVMNLYTGVVRGHFKEADAIYKNMHKEKLSGNQLFCWVNGRMMEATATKDRMWPRHGLILWQLISRLFRGEGMTCAI